MFKKVILVMLATVMLFNMSVFAAEDPRVVEFYEINKEILTMFSTKI